MRWWRVALGGCLAVAGCGGGGRASMPDAAATVDGGGVCADLTRQAMDYVAAHQSCTVDSDCTGVPNFPFVYDTGSRVSCWPQVVISTDAVSGLSSFMDQLRAAMCDGPPGPCDALVPQAKCAQNVCAFAE